jgi:SPP1 family predicted phage head-tail adaptor
MMKRPKMNRRLRLEEPVQISDGAGGHAINWQEIGILWGEVAARTGREVAGAGAALSKVPYRITVRAAPVGSPSRPDAGQRFRDGTRSFAIVAVAEGDGDGRFLVCVAEEEIVA